MRLPDERRHPLFKGLTVLACAGLLAGCGALGSGSSNAALASVAALPANGPQADYPVLVGEAYDVAGVTFTPDDTLNYDEVGYLAAESAGDGITGAHHTLPVPSYIEVTSLTSGRTILVRLERRGPMASTHLLALSPTAMAQLQADPETPVRVRRVNPPEAQRAMLRAGGSAPLRMETPMSLVNVLRRNLPEHLMPTLSEPVPVVETAEASLPALPSLEETGDSFEAVFADDAASATETEAVAVAELTTSGVEQAADGGFVVQAAAFSTEDRARRVADTLSGIVTRSGRFFRVRTGPFASRTEAEASLAIVKAAGYTDARILTSG